MITIESLTASYGIHDLEGFTLEPGENLAIIGPNGAGKSTLLKLIFGAITPSSGMIRFDSQTTQTASHGPRWQEVSFMPTYEDRINGLSVFDSVAIGFSAQRSLFDRLSKAQESAIKTALEHVEMWLHRGKKVDRLSAGEYQRVRLARQFALGRSVLLLDEPFSYLDPQHVLKISTHLHQLSVLNKNVIITSHELNHAARCCQKMLILEDGKQAIFGPTPDIMRSETLRRVFKVDFVPVSHPDTDEPQLLFPREQPQ